MMEVFYEAIDNFNFGLEIIEADLMVHATPCMLDILTTGVSF